MYHGHTFTSKIPFREVVSTLGKYAFQVGRCESRLASAGLGGVLRGGDGALGGQQCWGTVGTVAVAVPGGIGA